MNCSDCYFGRKPGEAFNNSCHRNPLPVYASTAHWCGEHKPVDHLSGRVFDGTRPIAADDSARLHARYKDHIGKKPILRLPNKAK